MARWRAADAKCHDDKITMNITVIGGTVGCETVVPQPRLKSTASRPRTAHTTHGARPRAGAGGRRDWRSPAGRVGTLRQSLPAAGARRVRRLTSPPLPLSPRSASPRWTTWSSSAAGVARIGCISIGGLPGLAGATSRTGASSVAQLHRPESAAPVPESRLPAAPAVAAPMP